jgi:hypothetical protein
MKEGDGDRGLCCCYALESKIDEWIEAIRGELQGCEAKDQHREAHLRHHQFGAVQAQ